MNVLGGIYLLLWKNFKLKLRHPLVLLMELGIPCLFSVILAIVRVLITFDDIPTVTTFPPFSVDNWQSLQKKTFLYAPRSPKADILMDTFKNTSLAEPTLMAFESEQLLEEYYLKENSDSIACALIFGSNTNDSNVNVQVRFPFVPKQKAGFDFRKIDQFTWQTARLFPMFREPGPRSPDQLEGGPPNYQDEGFLYVQHQLAKSIALNFNSSLKDRLEKISVKVQRFPFPPYSNDKFLFSLQFLFPLVLMLSFIYPSVSLTKNIVLEKEQRLKEAMKMMGLQDWLHWTSWFLNSLIWSSVSLLIITVLLCVQLKPNLAIIGNSNPVIIFVFFLFYTICSISFCFLLSTLFSRANVAGVIAGAVYFATFLPYFQVNIYYHELSLVLKLLISSIFNTNMAIGCMLITMWESEHVGLQWWNLSKPASPDDDLTFLHVLGMFLFSSLVYFMLALYIQTVFPGEFGLGKKWYFFVDPDYWRGLFSAPAHRNSIQMDELKKSKVLQMDSPDSVTIENLSKSYDRGKTYAVNSLNLELENNEITVLLGHNGAGKTTLMSILCGLLPPTSGSVTVNGLDLVKDLNKIRKQLGICPQFDVLFEHLTVSEHLWFYLKLKDIPDKEIQPEIDKMIELLDLEPKRHKRAITLSGGMKRKLSVGIALVGGSRFVLLDEATSGMDVSARRFIWDLLIREKQGRVILLSTHFMEEADVLGDKIAIVENGTLKCAGSPMELKKQFGLGYLMTFVIRDEKTNTRVLHDLIRAHIHQSKLLTSVGTELTFSLPETETHKFEKLFQTIEQNLEKLGVINYGISVTTIEEVFLRVGDFAKQGTEQANNFSRDKESKEKDNPMLENIRPNSLAVNHGLSHMAQVYWSLLSKKMLYFIRNPFLVFAQFPLPSLLLVISVLNSRTQMNKVISAPPMPLTISPYKTLYMSTFRDSSTEAEKLSQIYASIVQSSDVEVVLNDTVYTNDTFHQSISYLADYGTRHEAEYNLFYMLGARFEWDDDQLVLTGLFNNQAYHISATSLALLENVLLKYLLPNNNVQLNVVNKPLPRKQRDTLSAREFDSTLQVQLSNSILFSTCFLLASFIILLVNEKKSNFKHLQQISGLRLSHYWLGNFILDYATYVTSSLMMALAIYLLKVDAFQTISQLGYLSIAFAATGLAALPLIYVCSLIFGDPATAYVRVSLYMLIAGTTTFLMVLILQIPDFDLIGLSQTMDSIFSFILPVYTLSISVFSIYQNYKSQEFCLGNITWLNTTFRVQDFCQESMSGVFPPLRACCKGKCGKLCFNYEENYLAWDKPGLGQYLTAFICQALLFWIVLAILEYGQINFRFLGSLFSSKTSDFEHIQGDDDVRAEEDRIRRRSFFTLNKSDSMVVQNLSKKYGNFFAVNDISFGVKRAECFGILGVNGAGKTTTFKMITGAEKITSGDIIINGKNVKHGMSQIYKDIGYCPQFDGLLDQLTGRETLRIVSRIRGLQESVIEGQVDSLSKLLFFSKHIDKNVSSYSGGTKRKLSFAMSIIGNPLITFLDEPTTGVDPVSRRCLWNAIQLVRAAGSSVALTSHSMEECEALCNRLFIMVNSKISCIGSPLHLKQKYGAGYIVQIKLTADNTEKALNELSKMLISRWPSCRLESGHNHLFTFRIETNDVKLSTLFGDIERAKESFGIEDYSICQTSLESIFLAFARKQRSI